MLNCYKQLNPRGNLAPKEEQPLAAEETGGGSSLLRTVQSCLESSYGLVRSDEEITQRQEPVHGDLDVVIGLVKQHKNFEEKLNSRVKLVEQLKRTVEALKNCQEGGCCHNQGPGRKAKTILNPEKKPSA